MDGQRTTWLRNIAENFNRLIRVHQRYRRQTDRQTTDRRTEDDIIIAKMNLSSRSLKTARHRRPTAGLRYRTDCEVFFHYCLMNYNVVTVVLQDDQKTAILSTMWNTTHGHFYRATACNKYTRYFQGLSVLSSVRLSNACFVTQEAHHEMRQRTWTFLRRHRTRTTK